MKTIVALCVVACLHLVGQECIVCVPVTNMVSTPAEYLCAAPVACKDVPYLLAQLQYNERVIEIEEKDHWSRIYAPSCYICSANGECTPLYAWVKSDHLAKKPADDHSAVSASIGLICVVPWTPVYIRTGDNPHAFQLKTAVSYGTKLQGILQEDGWWKVRLIDGEEVWVPAPCVKVDCTMTPADIRLQLVAHARQFLGGPYCWGGCSAPHALDHQNLRGFDCSGLIYRLFQGVGMSIPRNSRSQFFFATRCEPAELRAGDLIFFANVETPERISHVMLYTGEGTLIEAWAARGENGSMNVQPIREISIKERIGKSLESLAYGERVGRFVVYTGKLIDDVA